MKTFKQINLPIPVYQRLKERQHANQSMGGVITEALDGANCVSENTAKRLERYRTHARETIADLISNALDQLDELEKQLSVKR